VYHLLAGEVEGDERARCDGHAAACPPCARYLEVERSFGRFLSSRLPREPAPASLRAGIREALERQAPARRGWLSSFLFAPSTAGAVAALTLALLLGPAILGLQPGAAGPAAAAVRVSRVVTVVDLLCDQAGKAPEQQRGCRHGRHVNALKVADGTYWSLSLSQDNARELVFDPAARGNRLVVEGDFYPELSTIHLISMRPAEGVHL
jgi:hypothetical protein